VQVFEVRFFRRTKGITLFDKVRSFAIRKSLNFYESKDLNLDGLVMKAKCLRKGFSNKLYLQNKRK